MLGMGRIKRYFYNRNISKIHNLHRLENIECYRNIDEILKVFRSGGGFKHEYQAYKLFSLRQLLALKRPARILELGSGSTTAIFADYVKANDAKLTCIDEMADWLDQSARLAKIEAGDDRFELIHAEKKVVHTDDGALATCYDYQLQDCYDFVLIDGPSLRIDGKRRKDVVNADILTFIDGRLPETIIVDIRSATVEMLRSRLDINYEIQVSDVLRRSIAKNYRYFSVFQKNT